MRWLAAAVLALWPAAAHACAVCGAGDPTQAAFLGPTIFMSLFPLGLIAACVLWFLRKVRLAEARDRALDGEAAVSGTGQPVAGSRSG